MKNSSTSPGGPCQAKNNNTSYMPYLYMKAQGPNPATIIILSNLKVYGSSATISRYSRSQGKRYLIIILVDFTNLLISTPRR